MDNPIFENPEAKTVGGQNVPREGTKCPLSRKNVVVLTDYIPKGFSDKGSRLKADTDISPGSGLPDPLHNSYLSRNSATSSGGAAPPPTPPAVRESRSDKKPNREKWDSLYHEHKKRISKKKAKG